MKLRTLLAGTAATTAVAVAVAAPAVATKKPAPPTPAPTIAAVLLSDAAGDNKMGFDHNSRDYDIVTQAVLAFDDLTAAASNTEAELTVFAPNDQAFRMLVWELTKKWYWREADVFKALVDAAGLPTIKTVLTYHIIPTAIPASAAFQSDGAELTTLQGGKVTVDVRGGKKWRAIKLIDLDTNDRNPWVVQTDIGGALDNGYIHGINRVLRPIDLP